MKEQTKHKEADEAEGQPGETFGSEKEEEPDASHGGAGTDIGRLGLSLSLHFRGRDEHFFLDLAESQPRRARRRFKPGGNYARCSQTI